MLRFMKLAVPVIAIICYAGGVVLASDANLKSELADMQAKMAALESRLYAPTANVGDSPSLKSMKGTGAITIGGNVNVDVLAKFRDDVTSDRDQINSTEFHTNSADLRFKVAASADRYLFIKLDLDDRWYDDRLDNIYDQDDLLEEVRFVWKHIRGSDWGIVFGKGEVPYGQDKTLGIIQSYHHNHSSGTAVNDNAATSEGPIFLLGGTEENQEITANNTFSAVGPIAHPGEVDNVFMGSVNYTWKKIIKLEFTVFQNADTSGQERLTRGMHEDRPDDNLLFQSVAGRVWFLPTETLTLELSFIKMHIDSFGDRELSGDTAVPDQYAVSFGFDYKSKSAPIEIFGEWQTGWNWGYSDNYTVDIAQLGFIWGINESIDLGMMGEWLGIKAEEQGGDWDYTKFVVSGKYKFQNGMYTILEYGYEYMNAELAAGGDDDRQGHLLAFRMGWNF